MMEQRKNQRFDMRLPFEIIRSGAKTKVTGETRNVSSSGILFTSPEGVAIGDPIEYLITFPKAPGARSSVRLKCIGKVVREADAAFGATLERYEFLRESA